MSRTSETKSRYSLQKLLFFAIGLVLLGWMIWMADPYVLWQNVLKMRWWLLCLVAIWGVGYVLNAASWGTIVRAISPDAQRPSFTTLWRYTVTGFALNYITPFGLLGGEPYRVWVLRPYVGLGKAASSVLLYLMMHVCSHFFFWVVACIVALFTLQVHGQVAVALWIVIAGMTALIALFFKGYETGMVSRFFSTLSRWPLLGGKVGEWARRHSEQLARIDDDITDLLRHHPKQFWLSMGLEFASRIVNCAEIMVILWVLSPEGVGVDAGFGSSLFIVALSSLFANILFFFPLQMGTREGGIYMAMEVIWPAVASVVLMPLAVSISIMTRIREFVWIAIGLLLALPELKSKPKS